MNHIPIGELHEIIDGTLDAGRQSGINEHLAVCIQCRSSLAFERSLVQVGKRAYLALPSSEFTKTLMAKILPPTKLSLSNKLLLNLGNILAMAVVVTILYAATTQSSVVGQDSGAFTQSIIQTISHYVTPVLSYVSEKYPLTQAPLELTKNISDGQTIIIFSLMGSALILLVADRFFNRRMMKRETHKSVNVLSCF
jgi:hypothetical protein